MPETTSTGLVQQFIRKSERLYSLPAVAAEVIQLTSEQRADAGALKQCIERDPALTARILRVVNSSLFGATRQVTDLNQALSLLGTRPLKMLVLGFSLPKELFAGLEADVLARYWRRTLTKAAAARELAQRLWHISGDEAFTAGLVQDIGQLTLMQQIGPSYLTFLNHLQVHGGNVLEQELETLGFDHLILSARLLAHWGLPASLCAAVSVPPSMERVAELEPAEKTLPQILHLAELLARMLEQPYGPSLRHLLDAGGRYRGLTYEALKPIVAVLQQQVAELADVLSLDLPSDKGYADLLIAAQEQLAAETACVATELLGAGDETELLRLANSLRSEAEAAAGRATVVMPVGAVAGGAVAASSFGQVGSAGQAARQAAASVKRAATPPATTTSGCPTEVLTLDAPLLGMVSAAAQRCRQVRCSISLAVLAIDRYSDLLLQVGPAQATDLVHWLRISLTDWTGHRALATLAGESTCALVWEDCPRSDATELVRRALETAKAARKQPLGTRVEFTLSAGLATVEVLPRNFQPQQLIDAAQRCLSAAQLSGGDTLKSIAY
jgi:HD-like signal output (HDOD) protein